MSAGYDGKTIVWDVSFQFPYHTCKFFYMFYGFECFVDFQFQIWEGMPIRIFETSQFRLVDGKFSP